MSLPLRDLSTVIDRLVRVMEVSAGQDTRGLRAIQRSIEFTAPELRHLRWAQAQEWLEAHVDNQHPRYRELLDIWAGAR